MCYSISDFPMKFAILLIALLATRTSANLNTPNTQEATEVVVNDKIYRFGGYSLEDDCDKGCYMTRVDVFDSTSWSPFMNMTKELAAQGGTEMDGSIYLFGGSNDGGSSNEVFLIDIEAKNMTSLTAMPKRDHYISAAAIEEVDGQRAIYYAGYKGDIKRFEANGSQNHTDYVDKPNGGDAMCYCLLSSNDRKSLFYLTKNTLHLINVEDKTTRTITKEIEGLNNPSTTNCVLDSQDNFFVVQSNDLNKGVYYVNTKTTSNLQDWQNAGDYPDDFTRSLLSIGIIDDKFIYLSVAGVTDMFKIKNDS